MLRHILIKQQKYKPWNKEEFNLNIANYITSLRILAVPLVIYLLVKENFLYAFWCFLIAGISDLIDGLYAKTFKVQTRFGAILDPLADKLMIFSIYVMLGYYLSLVPSWVVSLIIARDVFIVAVFLILSYLKYDFEVKPIFISRINTAAQIMFAAYALFDLSFQIQLVSFFYGLMYFVVLTTLLSWGVYIWLCYDYLLHSAKKKT